MKWNVIVAGGVLIVALAAVIVLATGVFGSTSTADRIASYMKDITCESSDTDSVPLPLPKGSLLVPADLATRAKSLRVTSCDYAGGVVDDLGYASVAVRRVVEDRSAALRRMQYCLLGRDLVLFRLLVGTAKGLCDRIGAQVAGPPGAS